MSPPAGPAGDEVAGFVLAGGQSSRMGADKAMAELQGEPLIAHTLKQLREAGIPAAIAGGHPRLQAYAPVVEDAGAGPLGGLCAALASTQAGYAVFLSVDMPLLDASLLSLMVEDARITDAAVVLASVHGFAETFPAVVDRRLLPALQGELRRGNDGCFAALRAAAETTRRPFRVLAVENLVQCGRVNDLALPPGLWFLNLNTPADLARAESLVAVAHRVT
jgi:molybdopterin-guanine dinucleotide biosynthesis protein A